MTPHLPAVVLPADDLPAVLPADDLPSVLPAGPVLNVVPLRERPPLTFAGLLRASWRTLASSIEWLFGAASLTVGLAVLAALPVLQFLTLGYLLEAGGRIGRTGRLRDGFIGVRQAARVGGIVLGAWLMLLPVRLAASLSVAAEIADPGSPVAQRWRAGWAVLTGLTALHIVVACARGGRLRHFLWPFTNPIWLIRRLFRGGLFTEARDAAWDFVVALRLPYYFWLGLRGFIAALAWLALPVTLLAAGQKAPVLGFLGAFLLGIVLLYLPFLQLHFAAENRFRAAFSVRAVRRQYRKAPWAFAIALWAALLSAVPLYLLKIEMIPREAAWLPSLVFLVFIFPAKLLAGWAYGRAARRDTPRHWFCRWSGRLAAPPVVLFYLIVLFFSQYTSWNGVASLYEQHAFLLPVPFLGMK